MIVKSFRGFPKPNSTSIVSSAFYPIDFNKIYNLFPTMIHVIKLVTSHSIPSGVAEAANRRGSRRTRHASDNLRCRLIVTPELELLNPKIRRRSQ